MTNEEAIKMLIRLKDRINFEVTDAQGKMDALNMAIKALEQQPCEDWHDVPSDEMTLEQARQAVKDLRKKLVEYLMQEPCDDCISRSDVKKYLSAPDANGDRVIYESDLDLLPSVTPKEKTGHWKPIEYDGYADGYPVWDVWECSKCGLEHNGDKESLTAFCPDCGAKMIEPQESEK